MSGIGVLPAVVMITAYYADLWPRKTFSVLLCVLPTSPNVLRAFENCSSRLLKKWVRGWLWHSVSARFVPFVIESSVFGGLAVGRKVP